MPSRVRVIVGDAEWLAEVSGRQVRLVDVEHPFDISPADDGRFVVDGAEVAFTLTAAAAGRSIWIGSGGHVLEVEVHPASGAGHGRARDHDLLGPPMPATVVRIAVRPGDVVHAGDVLIALEAMKMELPIRAPRDGVIRAVHCREGEMVQSGTILVELD
jgi:3-methylcrotonyl-CoA carboxylase alpha subunit